MANCVNCGVPLEREEWVCCHAGHCIANLREQRDAALAKLKEREKAARWLMDQIDDPHAQQNAYEKSKTCWTWLEEKNDNTKQGR